MKKLLLIMFGLLVLSGCTSKHIVPQPPSASAGTLTAEQSAIVFFRPSILGGAVQAPVVDVSGENLSLVGIFSSKSKMLHVTTPGQHRYAVGGESSALLSADLEGGKFYYVQIEPHVGAFKARFSLDPITPDKLTSKDVKDDLAACTWYTDAPSAQEWFGQNLGSLQEKKQTALQKYDKADIEKRSVIHKNYGVDVLMR